MFVNVQDFSLVYVCAQVFKELALRLFSDCILLDVVI